MRRILLAALAFALVAGAFAGVASARFASDRPSGPDVAPFRAPAAAPREDAAHQDTYSFTSAERIAARMQGAAATSADTAPAGGASATVTVTAVVLPVVTIVVDEDGGDVIELFTNTPDRDPRGVVYAVRVGSLEGPAAELDAETWRAAREALARAHAGTGTIWSA